VRIAIDASRTVVPRITGTEHYAIQLIRHLIRHNTRHHITLYFRDSPPPDLFPESNLVEQRIIPQRRFWTQTRFAAAIWQDRPDVTFVPAHTLPLMFPGKAAVTVHDLGYHYYPQAHPFVSRTYLQWMTPFSARRADVILVDSRATGDDLARIYHIPPEKMQIVYPGVDAPQIGDVAAMRAKYHLPERYFLFVGTLQPRKNIDRLAQAYSRWRADHPVDETALVLAGGQGWLYDPAWTAGVEGVILPGYIDEADKGALYAGALALTFPSLYEGFGFPVIEAMRCGTPVLCSNGSSLPELAGEAALLVDPLDVDAIAAGMARLAADKALRAQLSAAGKLQAQTFTWEAAAAAALAALEASVV
jgi:glycosyltransferase involved in cell wall biosynthesis